VFFKGDKIIKQRFKNVNTFIDKVIDYKIININEYIHIDINTYRLMLTESVDILTSSLNKRTNANNKLPLSLMQRFTVEHSKDLV
jgi:hypothetical protein